MYIFFPDTHFHAFTCKQIYFKIADVLATQHQTSYKMFALRNGSASLLDFAVFIFCIFWGSLMQIYGDFWLDKAK